ncbi:MAG TPA: hypothetical protein VEK73_09625 [Xanthobacteraceae bacterium]|nr:hypothetical protein [Xanthobacteraceae bacterium]
MSDDVKLRCVGRAARPQPKMPDVVNQIVARSDPARLMELYYWTQEPGLLEIVRAVAAMPAAGREALESFFALGGDPQSIVATWETDGRLSLESNNLGQALEVIGYLLADPTGINRESEPN